MFEGRPALRVIALRGMARHAAVFAFFVGLSVILTWPLAVRLDTIVSDLGDPLLVTWILDWTSHALLRNV